MVSLENFDKGKILKFNVLKNENAGLSIRCKLSDGVK